MLHLAGASKIVAQRREDPTADSASTPTPSATGIVSGDIIHPALLQYMQAIQDSDANIHDSSDLQDTDPSRVNALLSGGPPSGYGLDPSRVPHGMSGVASTSVGALPTQQPLPQVPADSRLWSSFESKQSPPFAEGPPGEATYSLDSIPDFNSIFRFQTPSLHTQYPQLSGATPPFEQTQNIGPSPAFNDLSREFAVGEMRMGDMETTSGLDFRRFMVENVPGLTSDGMDTGWEAFLTGLHS